MNQRNWDEERAASDRVFHIREPIGAARLGKEYLSIPKADIPLLTNLYINELETGESSEWCKCEWQIHPDDVDIPDGHCRNCGDKKGTHDPEGPCMRGDCECKEFKGRRQRRKDDHPQCPAHTKEGLVLGFFEWAFRDQSTD